MAAKMEWPQQMLIKELNMAAGHVFRGWSLIFLWWGCLTILCPDNSKSNSWNDLVAFVKDRYSVSVAGPGILPSIIQFQHQRRKQRVGFYFHTRLSYNVNGTSTFHVSRLPLCGDVATNPGPPMPKAPKFSCNECNKTIRRNQDAILCAECSGWFHAKCLYMSKAGFLYYSYSQASNWTCGLCSLPRLTAECYQQSSYADSDSSDSDNQNEMWNEFDTVLQKHRANVKIGHINVDSIAGFKFHEIKTWLLDGRFDILVVSETKIDSTFPNSQFHISGFKMCRADRTKGGGGLMVYIRSDFCFKVVRDLPNLPLSERAEYKTESIVLKVMIGKTWETIVGIYRPPTSVKVPKSVWTYKLGSLLEAVTSLPGNYFLVGDYNADLIAPDKPPKDE